VISAAVIGAYAPDPDRYRPATCPSWVDELDLSIGRAHVRMGVHAVDGEDWLRPDGLAVTELPLRRRLLSEQPDSVFACRDSARSAAEEAASCVFDWLSQRGITPADGVEDPLARAAMSAQEDLCLMVRREGGWHLDGACLCFPSMWSLTEKMGLPAASVHAPVDHYADELAARVDTFFDRLRPESLAWRRNLSLWPCCLLWVPTPTVDDALWDPPAPPGSPRLWLRSERQTLRRLPVSGAILFTIKVQMAPLSVLAGRPDRAAALAAWLRSVGGEGRRRQLGPLLDPDLAWLDGAGQG
jgi:hypothetical protein